MDSDLVRQIVNKKEDFLRRHLVLSDSVIEKLWQMDVVGAYAKQQMEADKGNSARQMNLLIAALKIRGLKAFQGFLDVLRMTFHGWIADDIMGSAIEIEDKQTGNKTGNNIYVRDILNRSYQTSLAEGQVRYRPVFLDKGELPAIPYIFVQPQSHRRTSGSSSNGHRRENRRRRRRSGDHLMRNGFDEINPYEILSPITKVPENLRHLQNVFDKESSVTQKSMAVLRHEEITIKSLLQQNLREQQEVISKQQALSEINDRIKQINNRATHLYKPEVRSEMARSRLRHLQKMPWLEDD